jgi:hypothetical protein
VPWLPAPKADALIAEGPLELAPEDLEDVRGEDDEDEPVELDPRNMPAAGFGEPEVWPLADRYPVDEMPEEMRRRASEGDFYLVRLHCSFRPKHKEIEIEWARFVVQLLAADGGKPPTAVDMHPKAEVTEVAHNRKFTLSPSLAFTPVTVSMGELAFGFEYNALEPKVWGALDPADTPSWDYQPTTGQPLVGNREMHLLVRAPDNSAGARARLHLVADIKRKRLLGRAKLNRDQAPDEFDLW